MSVEELFKEPYTVSSRLELKLQSAREKIQRRGPGDLEHIETRCLATQKRIRTKRLSVGPRGYEEQHSKSLYDYFFHRDQKRCRVQTHVAGVRSAARRSESMITALWPSSGFSVLTFQQLSECPEL